MRAVNLLPADAYAGTHWWGLDRGGEDATRRILLVLGTATAAAALLLAGLYLDARRVVGDRQQTLGALQVEADATGARAARAEQAGAVTRAHLGAIAGVASQRMVWENVLDDVSRLPPSVAGGFRLTSLAIQGPAAAAPAPGAPATTTGNTFTATGSASTHTAVALILERLKSLPWLANVKLQSSTVGGSQPGPAGVQFTIQGAVQSNGAR